MRACKRLTSFDGAMQSESFQRALHIDAMTAIQELVHRDPNLYLGMSHFLEALLAGKRWEEMTKVVEHIMSSVQAR